MSWSGIKHEPEIITVAFCEPQTVTYGMSDQEHEGIEALVFDEHGCEIGYLNLSYGFKDPDLMPAPTAEHPEREFFGWPEGIDQPVSLYNNVDEGWACPSVDAAVDAILYESAERADTSYSGDQSWYAVCETCDVAA